jgi:hypothetical protein
MDSFKLTSLLIETASFIAAFAAITAAIIMSRFVRKFVTGILALGFRTIGIGIFILALGIIIDAVNIYLKVLESPPVIDILLIIRQVFFIFGTYIIVIGSKNMGDKLAELSKHKSA